MKLYQHIDSLTAAVRRSRQPDRSLRLNTEDTDMLIQWLEEFSKGAQMLDETLDAMTPEDHYSLPEGAGPNVVSIFEHRRRK